MVAMGSDQPITALKTRFSAAKYKRSRETKGKKEKQRSWNTVRGEGNLRKGCKEPADHYVYLVVSAGHAPRYKTIKIHNVYTMHTKEYMRGGQAHFAHVILYSTYNVCVS